MIQKFGRGDVYFCTFPKFVQIPNTIDHNIDSLKPSIRPRPVVVLEQVTLNRVIAAPITSDGVQNNLLFDSYVLIRKGDYEFLTKDSFVKTNQVQILDTAWLYPSGSPKKVGELKNIDLDRVYQYTLYATQTEKEYVRWITQIVSKRVKVDPSQIRSKIEEKLGLPLKVSRTPVINFNRGDIFECHFQPIINSTSLERLHGNHKAIILTDARYAHIPQGQTIVVPLLENSHENMRYFSKYDVNARFEKKEYRVAVSQIQPMNRDWLDKHISRIKTTNQQIEIDRAVISVLGLREKVYKQANNLIQKLLKQHPPRGR